ncbi:MAG: hypothetical protein K8953_07385, partial [Proteobacteria bacterium]|nr:hypothetical protein [Pseudomonadota bacterium]
MGNTFDCTVGDTYLGARQSACAGEDIAAPSDGRCVSILSTLCAANPFNNAAGVGAMTIDCTVGETYKPQRDTACMADPVAYGDGCDALKVPICEATPLNEICREDERYAVEREKECDRDENNPKGTTCNLIILYRCGQEPFNPSAGAGAVKFPCTQAGTVIDPDVRKVAIARIAFCEDPENSEDPLCLVPTTLEFITTCANDPWNSICTNERIRSAYDDDRANRKAECRADVNRSGCNNTTVRGALCVADGTPFAPFCGADDVAGRVDFCNDIIDNSKPEDPRCDIVTAEFCSTATGADLFNVVCDADYTQRQVAACRADTTADPDGGCVDLITNNCPVDSTKPECAIATAAVWNDYAVNSDSTARLTVLDEVGA